MNLLCNGSGVIRVPFNDGYYKALDPNPNNLNRKAMSKIRDELDKLDYIEIKHKGFLDRNTGAGLFTRLAATDLFWGYLHDNHQISKSVAKKYLKKHSRDDPIIRRKPKDKFKVLKGGKVDLIQSKIQHDPDAIREILNEFNDYLSSVEIIDGYGHKLWSVQFLQIINHESEFITGRIYDGYHLQKLPKTFRRQLTLNGQGVIEIDFEAYSLAVICAIEKISITDNLYKLSSRNVSRETVKTAISIMLNTYSKQAANSAIYGNADCKRSLDHHKLNGKQLREAILSERKYLNDYTFTGIGYYLTYLDSQITLDIINELTQQRIPCIPIHDSFIVPATSEVTLIDIMVNSFRQITGDSQVTPRLKIYGSSKREFWPDS